MDPKEAKRRLRELNEKRKLALNAIAHRTDEQKAKGLKDGVPTAEERLELENMGEEAEALGAVVDAAIQLEADEARMQLLGEAEYRTDHPNEDAPLNPEMRDRNPNGELRTVGDFVAAVFCRDENRRLNHPAVRTGQEFGDPTKGGLMVPEQTLGTIQSVGPEAPIIRSRATVFPAGPSPDAALIIPAIVQGSDGVYSGLEIPQRNEKGAFTAEELSLRYVKLEPNERAVYIPLTDKLLRNWPACVAFVNSWLMKRGVGQEDYLFLRGTGVNQPLGIINSDARVSVSRDTSSQVKFADVASMFGSFMMDANPLWVASQTTIPYIIQLADANSNAIFVAGDATKGISGSLLGFPIRWTGRTPTLGNEGDLMLIDPAYYVIKDGYGPTIKQSEHVNFITTGETVVRYQTSYDGRPWMNEPLTLEDGSTEVSPFVVLL